MSNDLEKLREMMDGSIYKKRRFTEKEMKNLFQNVRSKEKRITRMPQILTIIFASIFLGIGGLYLQYYLVDGEVSGWKQTGSESWQDEESNFPDEPAITATWENIQSSNLKVPDYIGLAYLKDEEFLPDFSGDTSFVKVVEEDDQLLYRYTYTVDSINFLTIEQWDTRPGIPSWLEQQMRQLENKKILKAGDKTILLQREEDQNIGFFERGKLAFFVLGNADRISLDEVQEILEKITFEKTNPTE